jgi:hypothetical protein
MSNLSIPFHKFKFTVAWIWRNFETTVQLIIDCRGHKAVVTLVLTSSIWYGADKLRNNNKLCRPVPGRPLDINNAPNFILRAH